MRYAGNQILHVTATVTLGRGTLMELSEFDNPIFTISDQTKRVQFTYTNWKGETRKRQAILMEFFIGANEWHKEPQWLVKAIDLEKKNFRTFALKDMTDVKTIE